MARVITIPEKMTLKSALDYFADQLPSKESGWVELSGVVRGVDAYSSQIISPDDHVHLTHFACTLTKTKRHGYGTIANQKGQVLYTGPIDDLTSVELQGRLSMMPQAPWSPPDEPSIVSTTQRQRETVNLDNGEVSWSDLAQLANQTNELNSAPTPVSTAVQPSPQLTTQEFAVGDILMHPRFGRCKVVRAPSFGKIKIRKPSGAFSDLHLKVVQITRVEMTSGGRTIHVRIGKT